MTIDTSKQFHNKVGNWFCAILSGFFISGFLYTFIYQTPLVGKRELSIFLFSWVILVPILYFLNTYFLLKSLGKYSYKGRILWVILSIFLGLFFTIVTRQPNYIYIFLPRHTLDINLTPSSINREVSIEWFNTSLGDENFSEFQTEGAWEKAKDRIEFTGNAGGELHWEGKVGENARVVLSVNSSSGIVNLAWDKKNYPYDFSTMKEKTVTLQQSFTITPINRIIIIGLSTFFIGYLTLVITLLLTEIQIKSGRGAEKGKFAWLFYIIPMIVVWGVYFLTFFPGIITRDATSQWRQILAGQFNDTIPFGHTLLVILITKLWFSPAAIIIFQILTLSITIAWGIHILVVQGLPRWASWLLVGIFSISPINSYIVITLWKDIPYSTLLLLLSFMVLKVVLSHGEWLNNRGVWLWFGLVSLGISILRLNGPPIPFLTLLILLIVYRNHYKSLLGSLAVFLGFWLLFQGPVFNYFNVDRKAGFKQLIFIHHIAAHIATGDNLSQDDLNMASKILPMDEWSYDCCTNITIWGAPSYSEVRFAENANTIFKLFINLAIKEPQIEARHWVCVSSLIWELPSRCKLNHEPLSTDQFSWVNPNNMGIKEKSMIPVLIKPLMTIQWIIGQYPYDSIFYTPALYLYLGLYCTAIFAFRQKRKSFLLFMLPSGIQTIVMLVINVTRDFRYQYGVYLVSLFSVGLLLLAMTKPNLHIEKMKPK
jgi:hypothetical protein